MGTTTSLCPDVVKKAHEAGNAHAVQMRKLWTCASHMHMENQYSAETALESLRQSCGGSLLVCRMFAHREGHEDGAPCTLHFYPDERPPFGAVTRLMCHHANSALAAAPEAVFLATCKSENFGWVLLTARGDTVLALTRNGVDVYLQPIAVPGFVPDVGHLWWPVRSTLDRPVLVVDDRTGLVTAALVTWAAGPGPTERVLVVDGGTGLLRLLDHTEPGDSDVLHLSVYAVRETSA